MAPGLEINLILFTICIKIEIPVGLFFVNNTIFMKSIFPAYKNDSQNMKNVVTEQYGSVVITFITTHAISSSFFRCNEDE